jgi:AcrR family transcriptional regulator
VEAILDATARVLCSTGYDRASTNRIALAAGVSIGSLYQYFPSKEALVAALVERHTTETTALVRTKLAEVARAPLPVAVRTMIEAMFQAHMVDPMLHKVLIEQVPRVGKLERVHGLQREAQAMVELLLQARREDVCCADMAAASFVVCHAVEGITHAAVVGELEPSRARAVAEELTQMVLKYLAPQP